MTDEEKKAIYDIKRELTDEDRREYMNKWFADDLQILVNLIEKQSKEIEELKKKPTFLIKDIYSPKLKEISLQDVEGLIEQGREEIKDKIKAKIEEVKDGTFDAKIVLQSLLEKE